jgi:hypothetical protein
MILGWTAVVGGLVYLGLGLASLWKGQGLDGFDGLLFGGLALAAGCVILLRRRRMASGKQTESANAERDATVDRQRE